MGHSIVECELLTGTRSAEGIMASGPVSRTQRPNTWLLRPALQREEALDNPEPSTHGPLRLIARSSNSSAITR
jgi:hypothetical protein